MTTWFVSRHAGAVDWIRRQGYALDRIVDHLEAAHIAAGDIVIGNLPLNLAAQVCARGARLFVLVVDLPRELRGRELDADTLERYGARLERYHVELLEASAPAPAARVTRS